jgi:aspartate kinase
MKFGGTSVGSAEAIRRTTEIVRARLDRHPVVVVSALGGVTNMLLEAAHAAHKRKTGPEKSAKVIAERHAGVLRELALPADLVMAELVRLEEVLKGIFYLRELTARSLDYVASFGEAMSSQIVAAHFKAVGIPAKAWMGWDAGILTDDHHGEANVLPETWSRVRQKLGRTKRTEAAAEELPVVTGFLARTKGGERSTLGRGGSDYSAAILGRALDAEEIQIWTDVSGILSADPRVVKDAFTLRYVTFAEAAELAYFGAKVLHPKTIEPAVQAKIPVRILNTFAPDDPGTLVVAESTESEERPIEGIAVKKGNTLVNLHSTRMLDAAGYLQHVFDVLRRHDVSVDVIATSEVSISLTVDGQERPRLDTALEDLRKVATVRVWESKAIVAVVGEGMQIVPGIAARIFNVMGEAGINIEMISQGASELNVTFVVEDQMADLAMQKLHATFLAGQQRAIRE